MKNILGVSILLLLMHSCAEDEGTGNPPDLGYAYFPVEIGHFVEYRADSIWHDHPDVNQPGVHDTSSYYIRELVESEFADAAGEVSFRLERFKRNTESDPWNLVDVWFIKRTAQNAQKIEENVRYVKLGFPPSAGSDWDGNALNHRDTWIYRIDSVNAVRSYSGVEYNSTLTVVQRNNKNFVEDELAYEVYAPGIGLIYRYFRDLDTRLDYTSFPTAQNIRLGNEFIWEITDYGIE